MMGSKSLVVGCVCAIALAACGGAVATDDDETTTSFTETTMTTAASGTELTMVEPTTTTSMKTSTTSAMTTTTTTTTAERSTTTPAGTVPDDDGGEAVTGEVPQELMDQVFTAAEDETGTDRSDMTVLRAESVIWADGSLGCPEPGVVYTQATVDGYWVEISVGDRVLDYRLSSTGQIVLCAGGDITRPSDDS